MQPRGGLNSDEKPDLTECELSVNVTRPGHQLNPIARVGLAEYAVYMGFNRIHADMQGVGNFLILRTFRDQ